MPAGWEITARNSWASAFEGRPWATTLFVMLDVGVYLALTFGGGSGGWGVRQLEAVRWGALVGSLGQVEPWRYLSAMFVHFGLLHFGFNTLALYQLGRNLEEAVGWGRFVVVFLGTGIAGFLASEIFYARMPLTGGISGGIFGLLGAAVGWRYAQRDPEWKRLAISGIAYAVAMWLILRDGVNHAAHGGGLIVGAGLGWAMYRLGRGRRVNRWAILLGALLLAATFASIGLSLTSPLVRRVDRGLVAH
jgi:membrane associated rhomboid family serine protease